MRTTAHPTRENRTITVDFQNEATYCQLLGDGKAFLRVRVRLPPVHELSTETQGDLSRRRVPDAAFTLYARASRRSEHLADPVHDVQSGYR